MSSLGITSAISKPCRGELEFIIRDKTGRIVESRKEENIVKIFAKEILSHRLTHKNIWDPSSNSGAGAWVDSGINIDDFSPKYIVFGASYDENRIPNDTADARYYIPDPINGGTLPIALSPGAEYQGGLINAIPVAEPGRPLKRIERIFFEPSYQPAGTPFLQPDVRAINNIVVFETILRKEDYNGFGMTSTDYFTITEVALVGAPEIGSIGACECDPRTLFLQGDAEGYPLPVILTGSSTISLDSSVAIGDVDLIKEGDQIRITATGETGANAGFQGTSSDTLDQVDPFYLVVRKAEGGHDITLDRVPVDSSNTAIIGTYGAQRDVFRIFSHRILKFPLKKSEDFEITVRWSIIMN
jgi:hypothetical protein